MYNTNSFIPNWELAVLSGREILIPYPCPDNNLQICCLTEYTHSSTQVDTSVSAGHWSSGNKIFTIPRSSICFCLWAATSAWEFALLCLDTEGIICPHMQFCPPAKHTDTSPAQPRLQMCALLAHSGLSAEGRALPQQRGKKGQMKQTEEGINASLPYFLGTCTCNNSPHTV